MKKMAGVENTAPAAELWLPEWEEADWISASVAQVHMGVKVIVRAGNIASFHTYEICFEII